MAYTEETDSDLPLTGVRVLDLSQMIAGPAAGVWLADYGAEVIKLEPPHGDGGRMLSSAAAAHLDPPPMFGAYNRGKRGYRVDLKTPEGLDLARALLADADVLIESSLPGVMDRLGLGPEQLLEQFPRLIYASVSGFGWTPDGRELRGVDLIVQAESGMMSLTGSAEGPPTKVGFTVVDAACGHVLCHGILAALFQRERTGRGRWVRTSLYDVAINLQAAPVSEYGATGVQPGRFGNSAPHTSPADLFDCRDGQIIVAAYLQPHWQKLVHLLDDQTLAEDSRFASPQTRIVHRAEVYEALAGHFRRDTVASWLKRLRAAGILVAQVKGYSDVLSDAATLSPGLLDVEDGRATVRNPVDLVGSARSVTSAYELLDTAAELSFRHQPNSDGNDR